MAQIKDPAIRGDDDTAAHSLKCWPPYFAAIQANVKNFEVRRNDRGYRVGDMLLIREFDPGTKKYTGRLLYRKIIYILKGSVEFGLSPDFVIMGIADPRGNPDTTEAIERLERWANDPGAQCTRDDLAAVVALLKSGAGQ